MIKIFLPNDSMHSERKYSFSVMLKNILGLDIKFFFLNDLKKHFNNLNINKNYIHIVSEKNNLIRMADLFFNKFKSPMEYLKSENIPKIEYTANIYSPKNSHSAYKNNYSDIDSQARGLESDFESLPVFFSKPDFSFITKTAVNPEKNGPCSVFTIDTDLCAAAFFMLTRWEEYVLSAENPQKMDIYNRFPFHESLAYKNNFLHRPVVNEYAEILWYFIKKAGSVQTPKRQGFKIFPSHDIDSAEFPFSLKSLAGDILKRHDLNLFLNRLKIKTGIKKDPYVNFSYLMDLSEKAGLQSHFYFMSCSKGPYQKGYDPENIKFKNIFCEIFKRGHIIGFHPGFNTEKDPGLFNKEKNRLNQIIGRAINNPDFSVKQGRQHCLRFAAPFTWNIWNEAGLETDSTLGYAGHEGFRCGTGCIYPVFDFLNQKMLSLKEMPLIIMDGTLTNYRNLDYHESLDILNYYCRASQIFEMPFTLLFHNSSINNLLEPWKSWGNVYAAFLSAF